eukprot:90231-Alexandrium_andersonii.AAC.1
MSGGATPALGPDDAQLEPPSAPLADVPAVVPESGVSGAEQEESRAGGTEEASAPDVAAAEAEMPGVEAGQPAPTPGPESRVAWFNATG